MYLNHAFYQQKNNKEVLKVNLYVLAQYSRKLKSHLRLKVSFLSFSFVIGNSRDSLSDYEAMIKAYRGTGDSFGKR